MRKLLLFLLVALSVYLGYSYAKGQLTKKESGESPRPKTTILRFALVSDSENENDLLARALSQAKGSGVNFVIGLGDWSSVGTADQLLAAKKVFDESGLVYYVTAGDHDLWDSRNRGEEPTANFRAIFGNSTYVFEKEGVQFVILDNSDYIKGVSDQDWQLLESSLGTDGTNGTNGTKGSNGRNTFDSSEPSEPFVPFHLTFVLAHKTPFHPQSGHVMGEQTEEVSRQARKLMDLLEQKNVNGFFSGDLHFFARFNSPSGAVKMTTIGAVNSDRNFQGPRFAQVTVYSDYSWEVSDIEIR